jgi:hypothetical protein
MEAAPACAIGAGPGAVPPSTRKRTIGAGVHLIVCILRDNTGNSFADYDWIIIDLYVLVIFVDGASI